jgi:hypothetical protein
VIKLRRFLPERFFERVYFGSFQKRIGREANGALQTE